jgi:RNA polymerase subunit RPABC4/transcription elongation factor Spt4
MSIDPSIIKQLSTFAIGFSAAFIAALWLSLIFWTNRDIRRRSRDRAMRILAVVTVTALFLPGFLIYLVLRPSRTLEEEYQRALEEEALLQTIEDAALCPGCERHIHADWLVCPICGTLLKKKCESCGQLMELPWNICPYCATPVPGMPVAEEVLEYEETTSDEDLVTAEEETELKLEDESQSLLDDEFKSPI